MKGKKYIVVGGEVVSCTDRQRHYVNAFNLCNLYGLDREECYLVEGNDPKSCVGLPRDLLRLYPRYDGNYTLNRKGCKS